MAGYIARKTNDVLFDTFFFFFIESGVVPSTLCPFKA